MIGTDLELKTMNTENDLETKKEAKEMKLHKTANVHDFWKMWQGSQNLRANKKESRAHNMQITGVRYGLDTEEIVKASWSLFQHDGVAAFELSERSPLPPALPTKDHPEGRTQIINVQLIQRRGLRCARSIRYRA